MSRPSPFVRFYFRASRRTGMLLAVGAVLLFIASAVVLRGGMLHPEVYLYLPYYLDAHRSLLARVFDVSHADTGAYSARELSYFFDLVDAHIIAWGVDHGWPHFLSACHYVFCGATAAAMWWFARWRLRLSRIVSALLVALFLATPMVFLGGGYFRSAKSGAAFAFVLCACCVAPAFSTQRRTVRPGPWLGTLAATLLMGLFDRQGFFFGLLLALLLLFQALAARDRAGLVWLVAPLLALGLLQLYNYVVGPALIAHFEGYRPSFDFQHLPLGNLWHDRGALFDFLFYGPTLMLDYARFLLGDLPVAVVGGAMLAAVWWLGPHWPWAETVAARWTPAQRITRGRLMVALLPLALATMTALMVLRVKAVAGLDFRRIYYGLPSVALCWLALASAAACLTHSRVVRRGTIVFALAAVVAGNFLALMEHRQIARAGLYRDFYRTSPELLTALKHLDAVPATNTEPPFWPTFVNGQTTAGQDGIVRFFRRRQLERSRNSVPPP